MNDYASLERQLTAALALERRPVAVSYLESPPAGVAAFTGNLPSGCSFWPLAAQGRIFYTVAGDHYNCPIGSYTHNVPLPPDRAPELEQTLALMGNVGYIRMEEIPGIYRLPSTPAVVVYAPLGETPADPDVVVFSGRPARLMLLGEAAIRAGAVHTPLLSRPTCMALPAAMREGVVFSNGCIGNRVYTDLGEDELYAAVSGKLLAAIANEAAVIADANHQLAGYHRAKRESFATA